METLIEKEGLTQKEAAKGMGWSLSQVKKHSALLKNIVPPVLDLARQHQEGCGTPKVPNGTLDFSEGWFRTSGFGFSDFP